MIDRISRFDWERALDNAPASPTARAFLFALATFGNRHGESITVSDDSLARRMGGSVSTVQRHRAAMIAAGWIVVDRRGGRAGDGTTWSTRYRLSIPPEFRQMSTGQADRSTRSSTGQTRDVNRSETQPQPVRLTGEQEEHQEVPHVLGGRSVQVTTRAPGPIPPDHPMEWCPGRHPNGNPTGEPCAGCAEQVRARPKTQQTLENGRRIAAELAAMNGDPPPTFDIRDLFGGRNRPEIVESSVAAPAALPPGGAP